VWRGTATRSVVLPKHLDPKEIRSGLVRRARDFGLGDQKLA
jgi:hypothetical protein